MRQLLEIGAFMGLPMFAVFRICRAVDPKGKRAAAAAKRFPLLKRRKFLCQIGAMAAAVLVTGAAAAVMGIPHEVFYLVSGAEVGLIHGFGANLMYSD